MLVSLVTATHTYFFYNLYNLKAPIKYWHSTNMSICQHCHHYMGYLLKVTKISFFYICGYPTHFKDIKLLQNEYLTY